MEDVRGIRVPQQLTEASRASDPLIESFPNGNSRGVYKPPLMQTA